jgi:hypothetical protein
MNRLKLGFTCSYCSKIFKEPIALPCEDLICRTHLTEKEVIQNNKIKCKECKQEFEVKENEFKSIKFVQNKINDRIYLSNEERYLKHEMEESIKIFYRVLEDFYCIRNKLDLDCHEHFQEIRFQLDIHREKLKEKIDEIYMEMIEKTKKNEEKFMKNLNDKLSSTLKLFEIKSVGEDLKELEETFRDPNLSIELIREMYEKQERDFRKVQSTKSIMNKVKEDLNESNQFKSNLSFDKDSFGQLKLNEFSSFDPFKSQILTGQQSSELLKLCEFYPQERFKLLYRASEHGFGADDFHSKCDDHENTLTILKANECIFGGFASTSWDSTSQWKTDPNAYLFSLTNKENMPCKMNLKPNHFRFAIYCSSYYGPMFGDSNGDLCIASDANTNTNSHAELCRSFNHPKYIHGTDEAQSFLAGSFRFKVDEIEVYERYFGL